MLVLNANSDAKRFASFGLLSILQLGIAEIWIFVLFLIYVIATEVSTLFGDGELVKILFRGRSSDLKLIRPADSQLGAT